MIVELIKVSCWLIKSGLRLLETATELIEATTHACRKLVHLRHLLLRNTESRITSTGEHLIVRHIRVPHWGIGRHHISAIVGVSSELTRILSHLCHVFHYLVKLCNRVKLFRLLLLLRRLLLLEIRVRRWLLEIRVHRWSLLLLLLLDYRLHRWIEGDIFKEVEHRLCLLFNRLTDRWSSNR